MEVIPGKEAPADEPDPDSRLHIVRRLFRYRGSAYGTAGGGTLFLAGGRSERILGIFCLT